MSTAVVPRKITRLETVRNILSYLWAFKKINSIRFIDICLMDIAHDEMSSFSLAADSISTYTLTVVFCLENVLS